MTKWTFDSHHNGWGRNCISHKELGQSEHWIAHFTNEDGIEVRLGVTDGNVIFSIYDNKRCQIGDVEFPIPRSKDDLFRIWGAMVEQQLKEVE